MDMKPYIVYVRTDDAGRITAVDSSAFLTNTDGWTEIDIGYTQRHHHAQGNYFEKPIMDDRGIKRYQSVPAGDAHDRVTIVEYVKDGVTYAIYERTQEEMDADYVPPVHQPSDKERITALEAQLAAYEAAYEEGVNEA